MDDKKSPLEGYKCSFFKTYLKIKVLEFINNENVKTDDLESINKLIESIKISRGESNEIN